MSKKLISTIASLLLLLVGVSLGIILASSFGISGFSYFSIYHWTTVFTILLVFFFLIYMYKVKKDEKELSSTSKKTEQEYTLLHAEIDSLRTDFERFKREVRHFSSASLEMLFSLGNIWEKKEGDAFTEWKKRSYKEMKNKTAEIQWCQEILEECKPSNNGKNSNHNGK